MTIDHQTRNSGDSVTDSKVKKSEKPAVRLVSDEERLQIAHQNDGENLVVNWGFTNRS